MPIPTPSGGESQDAFIGRCMAQMKKEFPDREQRVAVCFSAWKDKGKKKASVVMERTSDGR